MKPLTLGVIGTGAMGRHHVRLLSAQPGAKLIGIADADAATRERVSREFGVPAFADYRELLARKPDAVSIAVPTSRHAETAQAALRAGCHVLLEKPIAQNSEAAQTIIRTARECGRILMIGHTERFNPVVGAVKEALQGEPIISLDMTRVGPFPPRIKDVGIIKDLAIHDIDIIRHLTGAEVERVHSLHTNAEGGHEDTAMILLKLSNGTLAHITTNWLTPFKARHFQVATLSKYIRADLLAQTVSIYSRTPKSEDGGLVQELALNAVEPLKAEFDAFVRSIRTGEPPAVTGEDGLKALAVAEICLQG